MKKFVLNTSFEPDKNGKDWNLYNPDGEKIFTLYDVESFADTNFFPSPDYIFDHLNSNLEEVRCFGYDFEEGVEDCFKKFFALDEELQDLLNEMMAEKIFAFLHKQEANG